MKRSVLPTLKLNVPRWAHPLTKPARYKAAYGGRGSGKSHFFAGLMIARHIANAEFASVCVREVQRTLEQSVKRLLELKIEELNAGSYFEVQQNIIKSTRGTGRIIFIGMQDRTAESIKSLESYDVAYVEQGERLSMKSLDQLRPTIRKPGSELWFAWNPREKTDPVDVFFRGPNIPPESITAEANYFDNPWFPEVLEKEMEYDKGRDPDKYQHVWLGGYLQNAESRVFRNWKIEDFETPKDAMFHFGADWGFSVDPTVLTRCFLVGRKLYIDYEAYQIGCEIMDIPNLFFTVPESEKWPLVADSARPETISHMKKHGFPKIYPAIKGPKSIEDGVEWLKSYEIIVHPRCRHTADELSTYSYKTDENGRVLPVLEDKKNHVIDALRYATEGLRRASASRPIKAHPLPIVSKF